MHRSWVGDQSGVCGMKAGETGPSDCGGGGKGSGEEGSVLRDRSHEEEFGFYSWCQRKLPEAF